MKAVVVTDGEPDPGDAIHLADADLVVAADGGARWLDAIGVMPAVLVGDLDSLDPELVARLEGAGVRVERHPADKDASDTELALHRARESGAEAIVVLGGLGGDRLDHEIANLLLLADPEMGEGDRDLWLIRGGTTVRVAHAGIGLRLSGRVGDLVSLLPIGGDAEGVRTEGLRFALNGERLALGPSRGLSNVVVSQPASVSLERGLLLVVETKSEGVNG
jgi:thiamine pyrophosphokinase